MTAFWMSWASSIFIASGFSRKTCLPAPQARMATST